MTGVVILIWLIGAAYIVTGWLRTEHWSAWRSPLARALGGTDIPGGVRCNHDGISVSILFTFTSERGTVRKWTYVEAALPPAYPFAVYLRGHSHMDALEIQRGALVDIVIDDPPFDAAYVVEGAPAEVVRRVLDPRVRELLLQRPPLKVDTVSGVIQLHGDGWAVDAELLRPWIEVVTAIVGGVRSAHGAADAAVPFAADGGAYRGIPDERPLHAARAARADEVQRLGAMRRARAPDATMAMIAVAVVVGLPLLYLLVTRQ